MLDSETPRSHIEKVIIPTRLQEDTAIAIFLLKDFGQVKFEGIEKAKIEIVTNLPHSETDITLIDKGTIAIDIGGGIFDHHNKPEKITATDLVCRYLNLNENPALEKLRAFAQRSDFFGKGIVSNDPLDRAFGLPAIIVSLNKKFNSEPNTIFQILSPILSAHYLEEERRTVGMPQEIEEKLKNGDIEIFAVKQRDKNLKCIFIFSDNVSLPGYLRSQLGGRFDLVIQQLSSGHLNILTRPTKRVDLRPLTAIIRRSELMKKGDSVVLPYTILSQTARLDKVPEWYYDPATNSLQNGGINPGQTAKTRLNRQEIIKLVKLSFSESF